MAKPNKQKRTRITNIAEQTKIMQAAGKKIHPPEGFDLEPDDLKSFNKIIAEFAKVEWTDHTLELAATLARAITDLRVAQKQLREEGPSIEGAKGGMIVNPVISAAKAQANLIFAMRRSLSLHARVLHGTKADTAERRAKSKELESRVEDDGEDDELIGSPHRAGGFDDLA